MGHFLQILKNLLTIKIVTGQVKVIITNEALKTSTGFRYKYNVL